jgi:hypothetical protein
MGNELDDYGCELMIYFQGGDVSVTFEVRDHTGIDRVVDFLMANYGDKNRCRAPKAYALPLLFPRKHDYFTNQLRFDFDLDTKIAAMMYTSSWPIEGTWVTRGAATSPEVWLHWDDDLGKDGRYPADAAVPISMIRPALWDLYDFKGRLPTCVNWRLWHETVW